MRVRKDVRALKYLFCSNFAVRKDIMSQQPLHCWFAQISTYFSRNMAIIWQAVTAKSPSSFKFWSKRPLTLASCKSSMVRLEKVWVNLVKRRLSLVWKTSVLASIQVSLSR